jgi:hypothetical protein
MAKMINWKTQPFIDACVGVSMDRLEEAANIIRDDMKQILTSQVEHKWKEHGPYTRRHQKKRKRDKSGKFTSSDQGPLVNLTGGFGPLWTARRYGALAKTIRVVRKKDSVSRNIWIMAGNWAVWWALQTEYGRGDWAGGRKSFIRPAMAKAPAAIQTCLEGGHGQTKGSPGY